MAATGKTPILLYGSTTATNAPVAGNLTNSSDGCEIAINVADKNLFFKDSTNAVNIVPIRQSSGSSDGWLSSANWTTFNSKQTAYTNLTSIGSLANATGWLYNNGSGTFSYSTPSASDVGAVPTSRTVSTTSPLAGGGALSSNLTLSITQATTSTSGYLSSTDWNTFNNKQPAGTYVTSVTGTAPVVSSGGTTPAISMAAATGSVNGYLTSTDWTTFNSKQAALVSGTNIKTVNGTTLLGSGDLGTIGTGYGGTGLTSFTNQGVVYASSTSALATNGNFTYNGSSAVGLPGSITSGTGVSTGDCSFELGGNRTGDGVSYIDMHSTSGSDYESRIIRYSGANGTFRVLNSGTGNTEFYNNGALAGYWNSTGNLTLSTGNLVIGTSGKGIDFSVTSQAAGMTSELLADYEEGDWTPAIGSGSGSITSYTSSGKYTKIGRLVTASFNITITNAGTGSGALRITPPFTPALSYEMGAGRENALTGYMLQIRADSSNVLVVVNYSNGNIVATNGNYLGSITYTV